MQIIKASAGSGKTYRLAYEYIRNVIGDPYRYRSTLAVTFTNKATDEMKWRILSELHALARNTGHGYVPMLLKDIKGLLPAEIRPRAAKALSLILHDYSRFSVMTIDRFFQKILHAFIKELGVENDYSIDFDYSYLLSMTADRLIDSVGTDRKTGEALSSFIDENIERGKGYQSLKNDLVKFSQIILAEEFNERSVREKEDVLTSFFEKTEELYETVIEAFQAQAAEAVAYIAAKGLSVSDFHYKKSGFAGYFYKVSEGICEDYGTRVTDALKPDAKWGNIDRSDIEFLKPILSTLCRFWDEHKMFIVTTREILKYYRSFLLLADTSRVLDEVCRERNTLLLPATTRLLGSLIADNDAPFIYEKSGNRYDTFMIDEFQDTSRAQWKNFAPLLRNAISLTPPGEDSVTLVGDIKQAIYRWRGGDWRLLQKEIYDDLPAGDIRDSVLDTNWRSAVDIVGFNNALIRKVTQSVSGKLEDFLLSQKEKNLLSETRFQELSGMMQGAYEHMEQRAARQEERGYISVEKHDYASGQNMTKCIELIEELQERGYRARDISILVRTNNEAQTIANKILAYRTAHPESPYNYDIVSEDALWIGNSETVHFIVDCMKLSGSPMEGNDDIALARYNRHLGRSLDSPLTPSENQAIGALRGLPLAEALETILHDYGLGDTSSETAYIQALHEQVIRFSAQNISDIPLFLEWWEKEGRKQSVNLPEGQDAVRIQTIHKSKGLEYKIVILPFLSWNLEPARNPFIWIETEAPYFAALNGMPVRYSEKLGDTLLSYSHAREKTLSYIENINLLYVAVTRAEKELYLMIPEQIPSKLNVGSCIEDSFDTKGDCVEIVNTPVTEHNVRGEITSGNRWTFGEKTPNEPADKADETECITNDYPSSDYRKRIAVRSETDRYDNLPGETLSPRHRGILLHKLFAGIETLEEIGSALDRMIYNGEMDETMRATVTEIVNRVQSDEKLSTLFQADWQIYNEHDILLPVKTGADNIVQRPDRVVIKGHRAYVLDYKSGNVEQARYDRQVRGYMDLLKKMGYSDVRGYIWYMLSGHVREII